MVAFGFYIDKKLLNESCGLRDAELGVDMQISLESRPWIRGIPLKPKLSNIKMEGDTDSNMDEEQPPRERKERDTKSLHLFNCDKTYKLDAVEDKLRFDISIEVLCFLRNEGMSRRTVLL